MLAGGKSSRMGRDKATLPYAGATLAEYVANLVREVTGAVTVLSDPDRYGSLGYPVYRDLVPGCGPLGGIYTGLSISTTDWNLMVACDMPALTAEALRSLVERAASARGDCVTASKSNGEPEPLCAVYHRRCLPVLKRAIQDKRLRMKDLMPELRTETLTVASALLANVNTPEEWREAIGKAE